MLKRKFIAGATALSIMLMGAGYAMWTQQVGVTNNVSNGTLKVQVDSTKFCDLPPYADGSGISLDGNGNVLTTIKNVYPGERFEYSVFVKNTGTIGARANLEPVNPPAGITITPTGNPPSANLVPGTTEEFRFVATVDDNAAQGQSYTIEQKVDYSQFNK